MSKEKTPLEVFDEWLEKETDKNVLTKLLFDIGDNNLDGVLQSLEVDRKKLKQKVSERLAVITGKNSNAPPDTRKYYHTDAHYSVLESGTGE